jgi:hypothetical protein
MIKHPIANASDGNEIFVNLIDSPASIAIARQPQLVTFAKEIIALTKLKKKNIILEFDMGRNVGNCDIVETTDKDFIVYAKPLRQNGFRRFVRRRAPVQTSLVTLILHFHDGEGYELHDAWFGSNTPAMPGSQEETKDSKTFWASHALVLDSYQLQSKTLTTVCPY